MDSDRLPIRHVPAVDPRNKYCIMRVLPRNAQIAGRVPSVSRINNSSKTSLSTNSLNPGTSVNQGLLIGVRGGQ